MKARILVVLGVIFLGTAVQAQYYIPKSPLQLPPGSLSEKAIADKIMNTRKLYTSIEIDELRVQIKRSNNAVDKRITVLKNEMTNLFMDKQELLKLKDIKKIKEHIKEKKQNREDIKKEIEQDLANISYKGLYAVVLQEVDPFASKESLAEQAERLLAPRAIEDLNGMFISSLSIVKDFTLLKDHIQATISGEMDIVKQYISRTFDNRSKFLCLVKVNVSPLKKPLKAEKPAADSEVNYVLVDLITTFDYQIPLQNQEVPASEISNIEFEVSSSSEVIVGENRTATRRQSEILKRGKANLQDVDDEITQLESSLTNRSQLL
ncbi:MAG: hypothetical protein R6V04_16090 [bacterium]